MTICQGVAPIVQQESLIVERAECTFLALYEKSVIWYVGDGQVVWLVDICRIQRLEEIKGTSAW